MVKQAKMAMDIQIRKRADEIREIMYANFSELKPALADYFLLLNSAPHIIKAQFHVPPAKQPEYVDILFDAISEAIARSEDQMAVHHDTSQILERVKKDLAEDVRRLIDEERDQSPGLH